MPHGVEHPAAKRGGRVDLVIGIDASQDLERDLAVAKVVDPFQTTE